MSQKNDCRAERITRFTGGVSSLIESSEPNELWYEFSVQQGEASRWFTVWETLLIQQAAFYHLPLKTVHVSTLKKWATGSGRAPKDDMVDRAISLLTEMGSCTSPLSYDEADAVCVLGYAVERP